MDPTLDDKEGTPVCEPTQLDTRVLFQNKDVLAINDATKEQELDRAHELIKHPAMTQQWMTRPQSNTGRPKWEQTMMPQLQTNAHYPKTSKQDN